MSTLIVQLPPQPRLGTQTSPLASATEAAMPYVLTGDGLHLAQRGESLPSQWPKADSMVLVLAPADVSWHRLTLPKAPAGKLRAAVMSLLEEQLLEDPQDLHLALAPHASAGQEAWVGVMNKAWLQQQLGALEAAGCHIDRIVPAWTPDGPAAAHVGRRGDQAWLSWRDEQGALHLPLHQGGTRWVSLQTDSDAQILWTASPDCADEVQAMSHDRLQALSMDQALLQACQSPWNLRQFELSARPKGSRLASEAWRQFRVAPQWRWVRWGMVGLLLVQLLAARLWVWQQDQRLAERKAERVRLLQTAYPHVKAIRDPLLQMQRELETARTASGQAAAGDLEPLLQAAETAWPAGRGPADMLIYEPGKLSIAGATWPAPDVETFRNQLRPLGIALDDTPSRLNLSPLSRKPGATAAASPQPVPIFGAPAGSSPATAAPAAAPPLPARPAPPAAALSERPTPAPGGFGSQKERQ